MFMIQTLEAHDKKLTRTFYVLATSSPT